MEKLRLVVLATMVAGFVACNSHNGKPEEKSESTSKTINVKVADLASNQDLVCGMKLVDGHIGDTASYQGKVYGFCSSECKSEFLKDPQSHLTQK